MKQLFPLAALLGFASLAAAQAPTIGNCTVLPADNIWNTRIDQLPVPVPPVHGDGTACLHENEYVTSPSAGCTLPGPYSSSIAMWWIGKRIAYNR